MRTPSDEKTNRPKIYYLIRNLVVPPRVFWGEEGNILHKTAGRLGRVGARRLGLLGATSLEGEDDPAVGVPLVEGDGMLLHEGEAEAGEGGEEVVEAEGVLH